MENKKNKKDCPLIDEIVKDNIKYVLDKISNELSELAIDTTAEDTAFSKGRMNGLQSALYVIAKWKVR